MAPSWPDIRLGELARIDIGGTPSRNVPAYWARQGGHPWLSIADLSSQWVNETAENITDAGVRHSNVKRIPAGTPVMSFKLTIGRVALAGCDIYSNEAIAAFHLEGERVHPMWLYYELPRAASRAITDNAVKGLTLNKAKLQQLTVKVPPIAEQQRIAEILDTLDEAIRKTVELIAKLKQVKQGLLHDLLTRGIDDNGELRNPERHPEQFKDSPLGRLPHHWDVLRVEELLAGVEPAMRSGPFGSALLKSELVDSGIPIVGIDNVHAERFVPEFTRFVSPGKAAELARYRVSPGDVMITIMGTVGRCCIVPNSVGHALSSKHVWTLTLDDTRYSAQLACLQFNYAPWLLRHFARDEQGGIMSAIRSETLRTALLPVLPRSEARGIEDVMVAASRSIGLEEASVAKLKLLKQGLMEDLLTGRVRVSNLLGEATA